MFFCNGLLFGSWVTRLPDIKSLIGLSDADLGIALLGAPVGSLLIMPLSGWVIARLELGRTVILSGVIHCVSLLWIGLAASQIQFTLALVIYGFMNAIMNISMNAAVANLERKSSHPFMSACHGMWSIGAMTGAGIGSLVIGFEIVTLSHLISIGSFCLIVITLLSKNLLSLKEAKNLGDRVFALPKGPLLILSFLAFCILLSEGAIADWSAIYMRDIVQSNPYFFGLAYAGFALCMTVGRFSGDALIPLLGKKRMVLLGGLISVCGLTLAIAGSGSTLLVILGFSLTGLGFSCIVPILFISAANEPGYASGTGIAAVTTLGTAGFLVGPPLIGLLSELFELRVGLGFVLLCALLVSILSARVKFR